MKIAYFVHDLCDPAVHRRVRMLQAGGAELSVAGFYRGQAPSQVGGVAPCVLGRTHDARLFHRLGMTARAAFNWDRLRDIVAGADVVIARQLEMLVIAEKARRLYRPAATLVFECLDVHRLMLSAGWPGRAMRLIEGRLLRRCQLLMVSSEGFVREYFTRNHPCLPAVLLSENKVLAAETEVSWSSRNAVRPAGPPWRIGWFGNIRCRRSLLLLANLTLQCRGRVEVVIRGRPARTAIPDFDQIVGDHPHVSFNGPYDRSTDLKEIYGDVHFAWTMDFFEAGGNSEWLLPNRLYEGGLYGAVALAFSEVETGRWLRSQNAGVLFDMPLEANLARYFTELDAPGYESARAAVERIPLGALVDGQAECRALVAALGQWPSPRESQVLEARAAAS